MSGQPVYVGAWIDPDLAVALDLAVRDARDTRAGHVRKLIVEALKVAGYLDATPRRRRGKRRVEAAL